MIKRIYLLALAILCSCSIDAQNLMFDEIEGLQFNQPLDIVNTGNAEDHRLFIVQKSGEIFIIDDPQNETPEKLNTPFLDLSDLVNTASEGGLLGLEFHPDFDENGYFFINYTFNDPNNGNQFSTRVSRWSVSDDPNVADENSEEVVITIPQPARNHNGGDILFGPDGYLYIPLGDGGGANDQFNTATNGQSLLGKILRLDVSELPYVIPEDNPFVGNPDFLDEIWTWGWRNPWRCGFDEETGDFWAGDVGQGTIEEIDLEPAGTDGGKFYGWSCKEGENFFNEDRCDIGSELIDPIFQYDHSQGQRSVTGGLVYRGSTYTDLMGKYLLTDFADSRVFWVLTKVDNETVDVERIQLPSSEAPFGVATFGESSAKDLYVASLQDGIIYEVKTDQISTVVNIAKKQFTIKPNPVNNKLYISIDETLIGNTFNIFDETGNAIKSWTANSKEQIIDVQDLASGIYFVKSENSKTTQRVLIAH